MSSNRDDPDDLPEVDQWFAMKMRNSDGSLKSQEERIRLINARTKPMTAPTPTPGARTLCCDCGVALNPIEREYYSNRCEACEMALHRQMQDDPFDSDEATAADDRATLREQLAKVEAEVVQLRETLKEEREAYALSARERNLFATKAKAAEAETARMRATNRDLHRRTQKAERFRDRWGGSISRVLHRLHDARCALRAAVSERDEARAALSQIQNEGGSRG